MKVIEGRNEGLDRDLHPLRCTSDGLTSVSHLKFYSFRVIIVLATVAAVVSAGCNPRRSDFSSGGLGVRRNDWERLHGRALVEDLASDVYKVPDQGALILSFHEGNCSMLERHHAPSAVSLDLARGESRQLIPNDSSLTRTYTSAPANLVDLYHSESLRTRFSKDVEWGGGGPGDFTVSYYNWSGVEGNGVEEFVIRIGNNP
jgi:hypothetical protein